MSILEVRSITKEFPAVRALDDVSLAFEMGEVHGLVGENGAGKSTLMKILSGLEQPTAGSLLAAGVEFHLASVREALDKGIAMIHQELNLVDDLTVAENIFLGREPQRRGMLDRQAMRTESAKTLERVGAAFGPDARVGELRLADKQLVEIAKAVSCAASILIMDEPTAVLSDRESESLFRLIDELKGQGLTIVYISHRLAEIERVCDRASVLRDGKLVATLSRGSFDPRALAKLMVGRELGDFYPEIPPRPEGEPTLVVKGARVRGIVESADLEVRAGEVVGIAGLVGSGRTELAEAIVGARRLSEGTVTLAGQPVRTGSVKRASELGIAYVSEDRKGTGLVMEMDVVENITLASLRAFCKPLVSRKAELEAAERWKEDLGIRAGDMRAEVLFLSGGNQQKVSIAKWLQTKPRVLILDEPTRGVDVGAKHEIYTLIHQLAREGLAVVVISSELPEIIGVCQRVVVMRQGRTVGELVGPEITEEAMMVLAAGVDAA
ncbi:MAG: sugar ABC transporter ATP-binding protein [Fimbriimonadaceae bacterium]|nr:sugar ABC transporter ATP-binding protein [Chthonomonadaceae bacterium]MCO5297389.1 sugar ABC transporter ATP-binding protein [Fimbriimonadaceae bacterium]